jgi:hypothetical protein
MDDTWHLTTWSKWVMTRLDLGDTWHLLVLPCQHDDFMMMLPIHVSLSKFSTCHTNDDIFKSMEGQVSSYDSSNSTVRTSHGSLSCFHILMLMSTVQTAMSSFFLVFLKISKGRNFLIQCPFEVIHALLERSHQYIHNEFLLKSIWDDQIWSFWILLDLFECSRSSWITPSHWRNFDPPKVWIF